jgi:SAM-dependent MidA family methyltransferase
LRRRIEREGPVPFRTFVEVALYDPDEGFYSRGGGAGRAGADFLTSPEVGPLFGELVARALDRWWDRLGRPDPYLVTELGAGRGRLAQQILRAQPACAPALRYLCVERSPALRRRQAELLPLEPPTVVLGPVLGDEEGIEVEAGRGPLVACLDELPRLGADGVVLANEVLDNLPFDVVRRAPDGSWQELRVAWGRTGPERLWTAAEPDLAGWCDDLDVPAGVELPAQRAAEQMVREAVHALRRGVVAIIDYAATISEITAGRRWLRTYRRHAPGGDPLHDPGGQDVTADVLVETLRRGVRRAGARLAAERSQAEWLAGLGVAELVEEGRRRWSAGAATADLEALAGRSRGPEAAALCDPAGLGGHRVFLCTLGMGPEAGC